jgi:hypothetical protein
MLSKDVLNVYLNDHLAGSVAACDLIEQARGHNQGTPLAQFFEGMLNEVNADRDELERLMDRLGIEKSNVKQAGTWLMEKVSRVKFAVSERPSADLRNLLELEALKLGVQGKHALWQGLQQLTDVDPRLQKEELAVLAGRAEQQIQAIEEQRVQAARAALVEA